MLKIQRDLNDIKSLMNILQNRVIDLEDQLNNFNNTTIQKSTTYIEAKSSISQTKEEEMKKRGDACAKSGLNYELELFHIVNKCKLKTSTNKLIDFNSQAIEKIKDLDKEYDLVCNDYNVNTFGIELKCYRTPDWGQCNLYFNTEKKVWEVSERSTLSTKLKTQLNNVFKKHIIFDNEEPIFIKQKMTSDEWYSYKAENENKFNDININLPKNLNFIKEYYSDKGNNYIQVSDGYGLYHLGEDICNFNVPEFICEQKIRIRVKKVRIRNDIIKLVVCASISPVDYCSMLKKSPYTLDTIEKLPENLIYENK